MSTETGEIVETLTAIVEALPDAAIVVDRDGFVIATNAAAGTLLETDVLARHVTSLIRAPAFLDALEHAQSGETATVNFETPVPTARSFSAHLALVPGDAVLIVLKDLTREQQIERMRVDFIANASHELRTPLASVLGLIETLQGAAKDDPAAQSRFLPIMRAQAERMKRLIDDLLSLSRIEMNEHVRPNACIDLAQVTTHVVDTLVGLPQYQGAEITIDVPGQLVVTGDWDQLVQVVHNLTENALKYGAGKQILISGQRNGGAVDLSVKDHGPGIAADHLPRLTERFYRVSAQDSRSKGGTGLGLAIVKHILNRHRGRLIVVSELGKGSTFTVRLPQNTE